MKITLSKNIKTLLSAYDLTREEFGEKVLNSSGSSVYTWLRGTSSPPLDKIVAICEAFDLDLNTLCFGEIGKTNQQYNKFLKGNHPHLVEETKTVYTNKEGEPHFYEGFLKNQENKAQLVRWLTENHEELVKDSLYKLYTDFIIVKGSAK